MKFELDNISLERWFIENKRDLPWRSSPTPYSVWISEVMLQQTQASVVIPYFNRWMERFPSVRSLAEANLEEVIKLWEGLGYYSRARYLHEGAQYIMDHHNGQLPQSRPELEKIKGLGEYTIGAIQSFAFQERAAAVDGNVLRVMTRYHTLNNDIAKANTRKIIADILLKTLPEKDSRISMEAIIELGATICQKNPKCSQCPLNNSCKGFLSGTEKQYPIKSKKIKIDKLYRAVALIHCENKVLVKQVEEGNVMAGLFEFPYFELDQSLISEKKLTSLVHERFKITVDEPHFLPNVKHGFTRYRVELYPGVFHLKLPKQIDGYQWISLNEIHTKAFSSGHRRVLQNWQEIS